MKEYKVQWFGAEIESSITKTIKAENERDAIDKAVEKYKVWSSYRAHPMLRIISDERGGDHKQFDNPNFDPNYKKENRAEQRAKQPAGSDGSVEWRESLGAPKSSGWATLYRACGCIIFLIGLIGTIGISQKNEEAGFQFAIVAITLTLSSFLAAFLIDVLTDMRHYLKRIAEKE